MIDPAYLLNLPPRITRHRFNRRDTILYALGVGAGQVPGAGTDLPFVLEDRLLALPTMAVTLAYSGFWQMEPEYGIDWQRVLHAEQSCEFHAPLPVEGEVRGEFVIDAIVDKGSDKGALLRATRRIYSESDDRLLATVRQLSFLRGDGGCGSGGAELNPLPAIPARDADMEIELLTRPEQALLYRLSGDRNPLHTDPAVARAAGFTRPVLHGLCAYGIVCRALLALACGNDPTRLKTLECRFTSPVFPGDALKLIVWRESEEELAFRATVPAGSVTVLDRGRARIARR